MKHKYIRIGRFSVGIRFHDRKFRWFYHPMLPCNEKAEFHFFIWIGWHLYACLARKNERKF